MSIFRRVLLLILSISTVTSLSTQTGPKKGNRKGIRPSRQPDFPPDVYLNPTQDSEENVFLSLLFGNLLGVSRESRLLKGRSYALKKVFASDNLEKMATLEDLSTPKTKWTKRIWFSSLFRVTMLVTSFYSFPGIVGFVSAHVESLDSIRNQNQFYSGITIIYATVISLTLSIQYDRQQKITELCAKETSVLLLMSRRILKLFQDDQEKLLESCYCIMDQVRLLVKASRGRELMKMIYSGPYEGIENVLLDRKEEWQKEDPGKDMKVLDSCLDMIQDLMLIRSQRLCAESTFLPPTHFAVLQILTVIILSGYTIGVANVVDETGQPPIENSAMFAVFFTVYVIFQQFIQDLNEPFGGLYQIRRSSVAAHLVSIKSAFQRHKIVSQYVSFDRVDEDENPTDFD